MDAVLWLEAPGGKRFRLLPDAEDIPPGAITETAEVRFRLAGKNLDIFSVELIVDDLQLDRVATTPTEALWKWPIGFHAGVAEVRLTGLGPRPLTLLVRTDPAREKLTREQYVRMIGDILADTTALAALSGHKIGIARGSTEPPGIARFEYLRHCLDRVERAIEEINRRPWLLLARERVTVPLGRSGGATALELSRSVRTAVSLTREQQDNLAPAAKALAAALGGRLPRTISKTVPIAHTRRREHADILAVLKQWRRYLLGVRKGLEAADPYETETGRLERMKRDCRAMVRRLERLERLPLFDGIVATRGPLSASHVFRRVPAYRTFFRAYRDFLAGVGDVVGTFLDIPLSRTFDLYERWCFLRFVHAAALEAGAAGAWRDAVAEQLDATKLIMRLEGRPFRFGAFTLLFQPSYREVWRTHGPDVGSFSRMMRPDIAFETATPPSATERPIIVLDAKYRVETALNDALASIHMYRDALIAKEGHGHRRTVAGGFVVTPHAPSYRAPDWRDDNTPNVFFRDEYQQAFRFGAVTLRPGVELAAVQALLRDLLTMTSAPP